MRTRFSFSFTMMAVLSALSSTAACKRTETTMEASASAAVAAAPLTAEGRCKVTTTGVPYDMIYFYPGRSELLMRTQDGMLYGPLTVSGRSATSADFTVKYWVDPEDKDSPRSQSGTLALSPGKWSFTFERFKSAECAPDDFSLTYRSLTEAGIRAGTWATREGFALTVLADGQRMFMKTKKASETLLYYRVLDKSETGVVVATSSTAPSTAAGDDWNVMTMSPVGDKLNVSMKDGNLVLTLEKPAPVAVPVSPLAGNPGPPAGRTPGSRPLAATSAPPAPSTTGAAAPPTNKGNCGCAPGDLMCTMKCSNGKR